MVAVMEVITVVTVKDVVHPGAILREDVLPYLGVSKVELARRLGVSRQSLYDILGEKRRVTPEMALRLERVVGSSAEMWVRMQNRYDLDEVRKIFAPQIEKLTKLR